MFESDMALLLCQSESLHAVLTPVGGLRHRDNFKGPQTARSAGAIASLHRALRPALGGLAKVLLRKRDSDA
jgi:hypothetical protein